MPVAASQALPRPKREGLNMVEALPDPVAGPDERGNALPARMQVGVRRIRIPASGQARRVLQAG
jgi:hypothetical protein